MEKQPKDEYHRKVEKYLKKKYTKEEVELDEVLVIKTKTPIGSRVSDIGPGGKEHNVKTDEHYSKQSQKMKDAINLHLRKGKSYQDAVSSSQKHVKEDIEQLDELKKSTVKSYLTKKLSKPGVPSQKDVTGAANASLRLMGRKPTSEEVELDESEAWTRKEGQNPSGGLNQKGVDSYRAAHPGSKLSTAVTTKPSKLKPGSKAANRRKSFCADRKSTRLNSSHTDISRMPSSA